MSENRNFQELRACDIEDLIQDVLNHLNDIDKKSPRNNEFDEFRQEQREYLEDLLQKLKEAYNAKGLDAEEYVEGVKSNIKRSEEKKSLDDDVGR